MLQCWGNGSQVEPGPADFGGERQETPVKRRVWPLLIAVQSAAALWSPRPALADSPVELSAAPLLTVSPRCNDDRCARGTGGAWEMGAFLRFPHHAVGLEFEHVRVPWRFESTARRTSFLIGYRAYWLSEGSWDPYFSIAIGQGQTRDDLGGCPRDVSGPALRVGVGASAFVWRDLRLGGRLVAGAMGYSVGCDDGGAASSAVEDSDRPVRATLGIGVEVAWSPNRGKRR